jgi:nucleobase:cation symporter-1, NCS1 family
MMGFAALIWAWVSVGSAVEILKASEEMSNHQNSSRSTVNVFFADLTAIVGVWATLSLNIMDFTRYTKSQVSLLPNNFKFNNFGFAFGGWFAGKMN